MASINITGLDASLAELAGGPSLSALSTKWAGA
jgi:hypothetical protein